MGRVSSEPHVRRDVARTAHNGQAATLWRCPRCGATVTLYVEPLEVRCSCGVPMRPSGEMPPPAKRKREVVQSGV